MTMTPTSLIFDFLKDLSRHNDREWFKAHRERYDSALEAVYGIASQLIVSVGEYDPESSMGLVAKDCVFRIYRDIRFSLDKSPYKQYFGIYIARGGKSSMRGGYYLHLQPGDHSFVAGGIWGARGAFLHAIRKSIDEEYDDFSAIVNEEGFRNAFSFPEDDKLKRVPLGFAKDSPATEFLKLKNFTPLSPLSDKDVLSKDFVERAETLFRKLSPLNEFLNYTYDQFNE